MPPIIFAKKGVICGFLHVLKKVQICICASGSALQSPNDVCKSF